MGCGASSDSSAEAGHNKQRKGRPQQHEAKHHRRRNDFEDVSDGTTSSAKNANNTSRQASAAGTHDDGSTDYSACIVPSAATALPPRSAEEDALSDISDPDLANSVSVRAQNSMPSTTNLEAQREATEVDLQSEFFVWDDANLDLNDMRAKHSVRKNMAQARDKNFLAKHVLTGAAAGGGSSGGGGSSTATAGGGKVFVFNDFTIEDSATMDMLNESGRGVNPFAKEKEKQKEKEKEIARAHSVVRRKTLARAMPSAELSKFPPHTPGDIKDFSVTTRIGHSSRVKCLAVSPGEREYISCSNDDSIVTYYDARTSQELGIFSGHQDTVIHAMFSPCGKFLATTSRDNALMLWDVVMQKVLLTFEHGKVVICCAFSKSSRFIATGCQDKVCRLWECRRGKELVAFAQHDGIIISLAISPDETQVTSASADRTLRIWTVAKGKPKAILRGHTHIILACNYTADGKKIISNDEKSVRVWSAPGGVNLRTVFVEDVLRGRNMPATKKQSWTLSCVAPKPFPNHLIVASNNRMVFVLNIETGEEALSVDTKAPVYCLAPGTRRLVMFGDSFGNVYMLKLTGFEGDEVELEARAGTTG